MPGASRYLAVMCNHEVYGDSLVTSSWNLELPKNLCAASLVMLVKTLDQ